uniref:Uncharacterized protein n=1 Tax=Arundo donax TaxID=35708 RepID=A0A0A8ZRI3_ARUDO
MPASFGKWTAAGAGDGLSWIWWSAKNLEKTLSAPAAGLPARGSAGRKSSQTSPTSVLGADLYLSNPDVVIAGCTGRFKSLDTGEPYITSRGRLKSEFQLRTRSYPLHDLYSTSFKNSVRQQGGPDPEAFSRPRTLRPAPWFSRCSYAAGGALPETAGPYPGPPGVGLQDPPGGSSRLRRGFEAVASLARGGC